MIASPVSGIMWRRATPSKIPADAQFRYDMTCSNFVDFLNRYGMKPPAAAINANANMAHH